MKNNNFVKGFIGLGFVVYLIAWAQKFIMTMDIPITFSTGEAFSVYMLLIISACMLLIGSFVIQRKQYRYRLLAIVSVLLILNCSSYKIAMSTEYFTPAYAQLLLSFILHNVIVVVVNGVLFTQVGHHQKTDGGGEPRGFDGV